MIFGKMCCSATLALYFTVKQAGGCPRQEFLCSYTASWASNSLRKLRCKLPSNCLLFSNKCYYSSLEHEQARADPRQCLPNRIRHYCKFSTIQSFANPLAILFYWIRWLYMLHIFFTLWKTKIVRFDAYICDLNKWTDNLYKSCFNRQYRGNEGQMRELQDQLEAEQYFSVSISPRIQMFLPFCNGVKSLCFSPPSDTLQNSG